MAVQADQQPNACASGAATNVGRPGSQTACGGECAVLSAESVVSDECASVGAVASEWLVVGA